MDFLQKIIIYIEFNSNAGIWESFGNGIDPKT